MSEYRYVCERCGQRCLLVHEPGAAQRTIHHQTLGTWRCPTHGKTKVTRARA
jgi:predicted nucleic acid-binding Zn ribbon protein